MPKELEPNRFQVFKVSLDTQQTRRDYTTGLTLDQARQYPLGKQKDAHGQFIWTYSVTGDDPRARSAHV